MGLAVNEACGQNLPKSYVCHGSLVERFASVCSSLVVERHVPLLRARQIDGIPQSDGASANFCPGPSASTICLTA